MADAADNADTKLTMKHIFNAPREKVFDAWLDAKQIPKWMGPHGVSATADKLEAKVGGKYRVVMVTPQGTPAVGGIYKEISRPDRLVFTWAWEAAHNDPPGHETLVTLTFRDVGGKTEMILLHERFATKEARDSHSHGWTGSIEKLATHLAG